MSTAEAACYSTPEESGLKVESLPFDRIPQQTRLFLEYLRDPVSLRRFYPSAVRFHHELPQRAPEVLANHRVDREKLCDVLVSMNKRWGATEETLKNIELLREPDCLAVVSGQQAGLFTGPLYTIYKALAAVKLAGCLRTRNTKSVSVFWIASEDHADLLRKSRQAARSGQDSGGTEPGDSAGRRQVRYSGRSSRQEHDSTSCSCSFNLQPPKSFKDEVCIREVR